MKSLQLNEITAVQHQELWSATTKPFSSADERNSELKMAKKKTNLTKTSKTSAWACSSEAACGKLIVWQLWYLSVTNSSSFLMEECFVVLTVISQDL